MARHLSGLLILFSLLIVASGHDFPPHKQYPPPPHHNKQHQYPNQPQNQYPHKHPHQPQNQYPNHQTQQLSSVEMRLVPGTRNRPYVTGGPLMQERYVFEQMHFHWGHNDRCGSEHRVDGKCFSMEVHVVMYNEKYGSNSEATRHPDGLTVISFFGEVSPRDNPNFNSLISKMALITEPETNTTGSFQKELSFLAILFHETTYFTFPGSLTTPPYSECVTWVVYPTKPFQISGRQISAFRRLRNSEGRVLVRGNDRALQPFGNRPLRQPLINGEPEIVNRFNGGSGPM